MTKATEPRSPSANSTLVTAQDVCEMFGIALRTLGLWVAKGNFPNPIKMNGPNAHRRWRLKDVEGLLERRAIGLK